MPPATARSAILVTSRSGQPTRRELERQAAAGTRPRRDYVELARRLDADIIDAEWMATRAHPVARRLARADMAAGQVVEGFLRRREYRHLLAWADRIGLPLACLLKAARSRSDLALISVWLSRGRKAVLLRHLRAHTHLRAIIGRSAQLEIAAERLGVPAEKLYVEPRPVDDLFWHPIAAATPRMISAAGWEARDYATLIAAVRDVDVDVELAVGSIALPEISSAGSLERVVGLRPGDRVNAASHGSVALRQLYAKSRFVVVPVHEVEFDAGVTAVTEAMAMGKAVIATRTRGLGDLFDDGEQGIYVAPGDTRAMRGAIERLLADPGVCERMGRAGRALVERRHRMDPCLDRLAAVVRGEAAPHGA